MVPQPPAAPPLEQIEADVARALAEDIGSGDVTAALLPHFAPEASQGGQRHACIQQVLQPFTVAQKQLPCHGAFAHQAALLFK